MPIRRPVDLIGIHDSTEDPPDSMLSRFFLYALPGALRTLSGVAAGSPHLPIEFCMAQTMKCVLAGEWLIPSAPYAALPAVIGR